MQEMAPRFSKFSGGACPRTPLANSLASLGRSLAALGRAPRIITLQSIFETWQACVCVCVGGGGGGLICVDNEGQDQSVISIPLEKALFFHPKVLIFFLISSRKYMLWVLIRSTSLRCFY